MTAALPQSPAPAGLFCARWRFGILPGMEKNVMNKDAQFEAGLAQRTAVMGEAFVAKAFDGMTPFSEPLQEYVTRNAWGTVWQRDGLDLKTRSLVTVAMLTALGKQNELKGHIRGALNNGATVAEIQEVLLHATVYCGFPTAVEAFRSAAEVVETAV